MPTVSISVLSTLPPDEALRVLTDFSPARSRAWPGVDAEHLTVHDAGDGWAEVTEGNSVGWERERYSWDPAAGTVSAVTLESNLWAAGSRWDYRLTPDGSGTRVEVTVVRQGKGLKGKLVGALLSLIGKRMVAQGLSSALRVRHR
jgi:hypothetical protein